MRHRSVARPVPGGRQTDRTARQVEEILQKISPLTDENGNPVLDDEGKQIQRIRAMRTMVGSGGARWYMSWDPEPSKSNFAEILIRTTDPLLTSDFAKQVRAVAEEGDDKLGITPALLVVLLL